jgi:hypothetical protein
MVKTPYVYTYMYLYKDINSRLPCSHRLRQNYIKSNLNLQKQKLKQIIMPKETSIVKALMIQRTWQISKIAKQDIRLDRMASILINEYNLSVIHSQ